MKPWKLWDVHHISWCRISSINSTVFFEALDHWHCHLLHWPSPQVWWFRKRTGEISSKMTKTDSGGLVLIVLIDIICPCFCHFLMFTEIILYPSIYNSYTSPFFGVSTNQQSQTAWRWSSVRTTWSGSLADEFVDQQTSTTKNKSLINIPKKDKVGLQGGDRIGSLFDFGLVQILCCINFHTYIRTWWYMIRWSHSGRRWRKSWLWASCCWLGGKKQASL